MSRPIRIIVSFVVVVIAFLVTVRVLGVPPESVEPPPMLYKNATYIAHGKVTGTSQEGFSGHLLSGPSVFNYVSYAFQPHPQKVKMPDGTVRPVDYPAPIEGRVRVADFGNDQIKAGVPVEVVYDPLNPKINGVPGSLGVWNTGAGYLNPYLWWYVGIIAATLILQELFRMIFRTSDL